MQSLGVALLVAMVLAVVALLATTAVTLAQEVTPTPPLSTPDPAPGPSAEDIGGATAGAVLGGLTSSLPSLISLGVTQFLGTLGHFVHDTMGGFFRGANIVTRFPAEWTVDNPVVLALWEGMRWLANGLLGITLVGALWEARERDDHPGTLPLESLKRLVLGGVAINGSMELARPVLGLFDAVYQWVATRPVVELLPGWSAASGADRRTAEGIGLLLYAVESVFLFLHSLGGLFYVDALLVIMPLCCWCATMPFEPLQHWFDVWVKAIGGALGAKLMLGVVLRLALAFVEGGLVQSSWPEVSTTVLSLLLGGAGLLVALKVASMGHAGVEMFHPFATANRMAGGARRAGAGVWSVVTLPFVGPAAAAGTAAAAGARGAAGAAAGQDGGARMAPSAPAPAP